MGEYNGGIKLERYEREGGDDGEVRVLKRGNGKRGDKYERIWEYRMRIMGGGGVLE